MTNSKNAKKDLNTVSKGNDLINAYCKLTVLEWRIVNYAVAMIPRSDIALPRLAIDINIDDFLNYYGLKKDLRPGRLWETVKTLHKHDIVFSDWTKDGQEIVKIRHWFSGADKHENGTIKLFVDQEMISFLGGLSEKYTVYRLGVTREFKCRYSFPMYELLARDRNKASDVILISIDQLRKTLRLGESYATFSNLRRRVIEPVFRDFEKCKALSVKWELIKAGRTVTHLQVVMKEKDWAAPPIKKPANKTHSKSIDKNLAKYAKPGESAEEVRARLNKLTKA